MQEIIYKQSIYHYQDNNQYTSKKDFDDIIRVYLNNLSSKKRDKALVNQEQYELILKVLQEPKNTSVSTAQFRFWVKKMFQLITLRNGQQIVCHDNKPVAMKEQIYDILIWAHRQSHHGGRDKTSALVRRKFSWIPKELVARFVRYCPYCITRRNGHLNTIFSNYPNDDHLYSYSLEDNDMKNNIPVCYSPLLQSTTSSPISSSTNSYPGYHSCCIPSPSIYNSNKNDIRENNNVDDRHNDTLLSSPENHPSSDDLLYPLPKLSISSTSTSVYSDPSSSSSVNTTTLLSPNPEYASTQINLYMDSNYYPLQQQNNMQYLSTNIVNNMKENGYKFEIPSPTRSSSISSSVSSVDYNPQQQQKQHLICHFPSSNMNEYHFLPNESKNQQVSNHQNHHHISGSESSSCMCESKQIPMPFNHHNPLHLMPFV